MRKIPFRLQKIINICLDKYEIRNRSWIHRQERALQKPFKHEIFDGLWCSALKYEKVNKLNRGKKCEASIASIFSTLHTNMHIELELMVMHCSNKAINTFTQFGTQVHPPRIHIRTYRIEAITQIITISFKMRYGCVCVRAWVNKCLFRLKFWMSHRKCVVGFKMRIIQSLSRNTCINTITTRTLIHTPHTEPKPKQHFF